MTITQILLGSTAAMLLAALILSYGAMRSGEAEDGRKQTAAELMQENARLQAEIDRLRGGGMHTSAAPVRPVSRAQVVEKPASMSEDELNEIEAQNKLLREQVAEAEAKRKQAEEETLAMNSRHVERHDREARRARLIEQAMLMAQVKELAQEEGKAIQFVVLDVKNPQSVRMNTELAIRRGTGIVGRLVVSNITEGNVFADVLPGTFPGGEIDVKVGDELIIPPL